MKKYILILIIIVLAGAIYGSTVVYKRSQTGKIEGKWQLVDPSTKKLAQTVYMFNNGLYYSNKGDNGDMVVNLGGVKKTYQLGQDSVLTLTSGEIVKKYKIKFKNFGKTMIMADTECSNNCDENYKRIGD